MSSFQVNERGTGPAHYHLRLVLAPLIRCHANGISRSRRVERATYRYLRVRHVAANWLNRMQEMMATWDALVYYRLRKQTVEPAFAFIKDAMGFRLFSLRGLENVAAEWILFLLAHNCQRFNNI